jgi:hypothetical protein
MTRNLFVLSQKPKLIDQTSTEAYGKYGWDEYRPLFRGTDSTYHNKDGQVMYRENANMSAVN